MSILLSFDLNKTYGFQNSDIAKVNKYNCIQVTRDEYKITEDASEYISEIDQSTDSADNQYSKLTSLKRIQNQQQSSLSWQSIYNGMFQVYYKEYSFSLDLTSPDYESLLPVIKAPKFNTFFNGTKYAEGLRKNPPEILSTVYTQSQWENLVNGDLTQNYFSLSGESGYFSNSYQVTENSYTKDNVTYNAFEDLTTIIQTIYDKTKDESISDIKKYFYPEITQWNNNGTTITGKVKLPYFARIMDCAWVGMIYTNNPSASRYSLYSEYDYYEYSFNSFELKIYNEYQVANTETIDYYDGNRVYDASESFILAKNNSFNEGSYSPYMSKKFADNVYNAYNAGKQIVNIKYPLSPIYDAWENQIFYLAGNGLVRKVGNVYLDENDNAITIEDESLLSPNITLEEGMSCVLKDGNEIITKANSDERQYYFIQEQNLNYNGICLNELSLATAEMSGLYIMSHPEFEHATLTYQVKKVGKSSYTSINNGATVSNGDIIRVSYTYHDVDDGYGVAEYLYINNTKVYQNGSGYWSWTVDDDDVIIEPTVYKTDEPYIINISNAGNLVVSKYSDPSVVYNDGDTVYGGNSLRLVGSCSNEYKLYATINGRVITGDDDTSLDYIFKVSGNTTIEFVPVKLQSRWLSLAFPQSRAIESIGYADNKFVCMTAYTSSSRYSNAILSTNLTNWTYIDLPVTENWEGIAYGNNMFVAVGSSGHSVISTDGINWTASSSASEAFAGVVYGNNVFVARKLNGLYYSTDGLTWTLGISPSAITRGLTFGNGIFVAVAGSKSYISTDGINWTEYSITSHPSSGTWAYWALLGYGNGKFVMFGYESQYMAVSTDGINWTVKELPVSSMWRSVAYGNGKFVVISGSGNSNMALKSTDGETWSKEILPFTASWKSVAYGNNKFVAVGFSDNFAVLSE